MRKTKLEDILIITESDLAGIDEMVYNPVTGNPADEFDKGSDGGKIKDRITWPKHDDHLHIGTTNRDVMMKLIEKAQEYGLSSTENPYAKNDPNGKIDQVHSKNSFHYKEFQGQPKVGAGVDFSGNQAKLREFIRWINANYKGKQISIDKAVEAPEAPKTDTKTDSSVTTTTTTINKTNYGRVYGALGIDGKKLAKLGDELWNTITAESTNDKTNPLNEEIARIKKMIDL
jgi:hypothetical protein